MKSTWKIAALAIIAMILLITVAIVSGQFLGGKNTPVVDSAPAVVKDSADASSGLQKVELLYFHRTDRCVSCNNAERYARDTLDKYYNDELQSGKITFQSIDYQQNKAMADQYHVNVQGLKIKTTSRDQENVKDVPQIWSYVNDKDAYIDYLKSVIDRELGR